MDKIKELIIVNLTRIMAERGLSQKDLADLADMDPVQLNRILKGKKGAGKKSLNAIALALNLPVDDLIESQKSKAPEATTPTIDDAISILSLLKTATPLQLDFVRAYLSGSAVSDARDKISSLHKKTDKT